MVLIPIRSWNSVTSEDFIPLPKQEALEEQRKLLKEWEPASEVRILKYGSLLVGVTVGLTSTAINGLFRTKLKLQTRLASSTFMSMVVPGLLSTAVYDHYITDNIMLYQAQCPLCYQLKAGLIVNLMAIAFPLISLPWLNLGLASYIGLRVPYVYDVKEVAQFWWSVVKPATTHLSYMLAINTLCSSVVSYRQVVSMEVIADVLLKMDEDLKNKSSDFWKNNDELNMPA